MQAAIQGMKQAVEGARLRDVRIHWDPVLASGRCGKGMLCVVQLMGGRQDRLREQAQQRQPQ